MWLSDNWTIAILNESIFFKFLILTSQKPYLYPYDSKCTEAQKSPQ